MIPRPDPYSASVIDPGADLTPDEVAFGRAMDRYRTKTGRRYPAMCECLAVLVSLGYRKVAPPAPLPAGRTPGKRRKAPAAFVNNPRRR